MMGGSPVVCNDSRGAKEGLIEPEGEMLGETEAEADGLAAPIEGEAECPSEGEALALGERDGEVLLAIDGEAEGDSLTDGEIDKLGEVLGD